ncbi:MAG: VanW family protein, partial [Candidatus Uhrbacteria bacterium]
ILDNAPYQLTYQDDQTWELTALTIANALEPVMVENEIRLGLNQLDMQVHLEAIAQEVEIEVQDAHFAMSNGRVTEFKASHNGVEFEQIETLEAITAMWLADQKETEIIVSVVEPRISTEQVNDLGISEMLGQGTSNFRGSPYNRIMNIKHGASKLNGILIAPDEEFSLLATLKPFTIEDGYLPELVIRGTEIVPEVGGGLCQIGTTTFRTVMNSGLPVTQRSNHSLVVSYYNDPNNGNPGTDATIYDPAPDFRFVNNTGNYILFTTNVDTETNILTFTFWGTSDGRRGYYSAPVVTSWIPYGEAQYVDTEDLDPGEEDCQSAHIGANANFTYYIEQADGTIEQTYYESHYRPLPTMCLVGIDPDAEVESEEENEELLGDIEEATEEIAE